MMSYQSSGRMGKEIHVARMVPDGVGVNVLRKSRDELLNKEKNQY